MKILLIACFFPVLLFSQRQLPEQYFTIQTEVDARNALFGGTVNERGYNGVYKAGFSAQFFRADIFFETFKVLNYTSAGVDLFYLLNYNRAFKQGVGVQISIIDKPKRPTPSLGLNALLEYHFRDFFVSARLERKLRTDWDIIVNSGFVGVGIKI